MENIIKKIKPHIEKIVSDNNLHLYDLEYVFENGAYFLRVSIEKDDGTMDFETAEVISNLVSAKLDELDPIDHEYILDVCSPGAERPIKSKEEMLMQVGNYVTIETNDASYTGTLLSFENDLITISYLVKTQKKKATINYNDVTNAHLAIKF